ncbi:MAG: hypothetical protein HRT47_04250 [Candidatus Caenarcaniphilales bacterium]|nr:hypothetical protein [Candidatus Caenarcaniphilales bacterium]
MSKFSNILRIFISLILIANSSDVFTLHVEAISQAPQQEKFKLRIEHEEKSAEPKRKHFELLVTDSIQEDLLLNGDTLSFKIPEKLATELQIPKNSYLETELHFDPNKLLEEDKNAYLDLKAIHDIHGQRIRCSGKLKLDIDKQNQNIEAKIKSNSILKATSNIVAGSIVATVDSLEYGGIPLMAITNGFSVLAAAGIGVVKGVYDSTKENKTISQIPSGSKMKLKVLEDFELIDKLFSEVIVKEAVNAETIGISLKIGDCKKIHSYNFGDSLALNLEIDNYSGIDFDITDLVLVDQESSQEFLFNPLLSSFDQNNFEVDGNSTKNLTLIYSLGSMNKLSSYQLRIINPLDSEETIYFPVKID